MPRGKVELSIAKLKGYLDQQMDKRQVLLREKKKLLKEMSKLDAKLSSLEGGAITGKRASNSHSLVETLQQVLSKTEGMRIPEIQEAAQKAGYVSTSDNFRSIINQTLIREKKLFTKLERGLYTLKK